MITNPTAYNQHLWATARNERRWMHLRRDAAIALSVRLNQGIGAVPWQTPSGDTTWNSEDPVHVANRNFLNQMCDGAAV